jgi:hypothetical protein
MLGLRALRMGIVRSDRAHNDAAIHDVIEHINERIGSAANDDHRCMLRREVSAEFALSRRPLPRAFRRRRTRASRTVRVGCGAYAIIQCSGHASARTLYVPIVQRPRTWPFQGQNTGSNPVGDVPNHQSNRHNRRPNGVCLCLRSICPDGHALDNAGNRRGRAE